MARNGGDRPDEVARCLLGGGSTRLVVATTTRTAREAARRHEASPHATVALGRGLTAGLLLATLTKDEERVTLQLLGDGTLGGITVDASSSGGARAYLRNPHAAVPGVPRAAPGRIALGAGVGHIGLVSVVRDLGLKSHFRGQTAITSGEIDEDVESYLVVSEQIDSVLRCDAVVAQDGALRAAAGVLVQTLPHSEGEALVQAVREHLAAHPLAELLDGAGAAPELTAEALARAVLGPHAASLQVLDVRPARFACPCSRERAAGSLALLGPAELQSMIIEDGRAEVTCNFCRERYDFTEAELENLRRRDQERSRTPPS